MVVAVACIFTWYWLADLCAQEGSPFVLGHALYMNAIQGGTAKNDTIDAQKIALLLRGGMLPQAYVYPAAMRATRDLLRRTTCSATWSYPTSGRPSRIMLTRCICYGLSLVLAKC